MKKRLFLNPLAATTIATVAIASLTTSQAAVTVTPDAGFTVTWDGNNGDHFGASVPDNLGLASNGGSPFASQDPSPHFPTHAVVKLNDGLYGNANSHINGAGPSPGHMGVLLPGTFQIDSIAWGRDNITITQIDRNLGIYNLEFTTNGGGSWTQIGTVEYTGVSESQRHEYDVGTTTGPLVGNGVRLVLPGIATAIDEIEVYGVVPEPTGMTLLGLALGGFLLGRRRR